MLSSRFVLCFLPVALVCSGFSVALASENPTAGLRAQWPVTSTHPFHGALQDEIGFSFTYDGNKIGPAIPAGWKVSHKDGPESAETVFRHSSGLAVIRQSRPHPEFEAVEYTLRFKNESESTLPALGRVNALDLTFAEDLLPGVTVVSSGGGMQESVYPPGQFAIRRHYLGGIDPMQGRGSLTLTTEGGRSSSRDLPRQ